MNGGLFAISVPLFLGGLALGNIVAGTNWLWWEGLLSGRQMQNRRERPEVSVIDSNKVS